MKVNHAIPLQEGGKVLTCISLPLAMNLRADVRSVLGSNLLQVTPLQLQVTFKSNL